MWHYNPLETFCDPFSPIFTKVASQLTSETIRIALNTLRPRQNGRRFANDIFKCIFMYQNVWISIKISLKFVPKGPISNIPALVQIMAWRRPGDKPLSEPMMVRLQTHISVTRPQWVNANWSVFVSGSSQHIMVWIKIHWGQVMHICVTILDYHCFR